MSETKLVEFVGGPLDGSCFRIPAAATHWNAALPLPENSTPYPGDENEAGPYRSAGFVTYKIERCFTGRPNTVGYRQYFKGVLE